MSDQRPFAPPVMPWLPAPTPRVVSAIPPPPNPWARIAANGHNPPPTRRKKKATPIAGKILLALIILLGAGGILLKIESAGKEAAPQQISTPVTIPVALDVPLAEPFHVQTEWLSFVLPMKPEISEVEQTIAGTAYTATSWIVEDVDINLRAITMDFQQPYDETTANRSFDGMVDGATARINGTVAYQTRLLTNGVYVREALIDTGTAYIHVRAYIKGTWMVAFAGFNDVAEPPAWLLTAAASLVFAA